MPRWQKALPRSDMRQAILDILAGGRPLTIGQICFALEARNAVTCRIGSIIREMAAAGEVVRETQPPARWSLAA